MKPYSLSPQLKMTLACGVTCLVLGSAWAISRRSGAVAAPSAMPRLAAASQTADPLTDIPAPTGNALSDKAIVQGIEQARTQPNDAKNWVRLGDALMQKARETADTRYYGYAENVYAKVLVLDAKNAAAMAGMAGIYARQRVLDKSVEWANKALALDPKNTAAYGVAGDVEMERGDYQAAMQQYKKMLEIRSDVSSYSRGASLLHVTGNNRRAQWLMLKALNTGTSEAADLAWCQAQLALMYFDTGNLMAAEQMLTKGLKTAPQNVPLLQAMGKVKAARKDYPAAISFYQKALAITPEPNALAALGDLYMVTGKTAEAEKQFVAVETLYTQRIQSSQASDPMQQAQFYADHDRNLSEALRLAEQNQHSDNIFDADMLAWCYYKAGNYSKAKDAIKRALKWKTPNARIRYHAGMILLKSGNRRAAQQWLAQALSLNPNFGLTEPDLAAKELNKLGNLTHTNSDNAVSDMGAKTKTQAQ